MLTRPPTNASSLRRGFVLAIAIQLSAVVATGAGCTDPATPAADAQPESVSSDVPPDGLDTGTDTDASDGDATATDAASDVAGPDLGPRRGLSRLTPEQMSNQLELSVNVALASEDPRYNFDLVLAPDFAIPLGGVDFSIASVRNDETRLQTLLVSRALAWLASVTLLGSEFETPNLITCQTLCAPGPNLDGLWAAQAQDLHWRIFNRAATADELGDIATLYNTALAQEQFPILAWNAVVFAFLSTAEFWHR